MALAALSNRGTIWTASRILWKALNDEVWEVRLLLLWVALEALYGPEDSREINFRISQRIAFFLGTNGDDRRRLYSEAKDGYTWRSKAVHGARLKTVDESTRLRVWAEAELLIRRTLVKILLDSDLTSSFDSKNRERLLDDLVFEN